MDRTGSPTTGCFMGRMLIGSLLAAVLGTNAADAEFRVSGGDTLSRVVMVVRHPEVRKLRTVPWKPFLPARPAAISLPSRRPDPEKYRGETVIPELPEMTLDLREQPVNRTAEAENGSHPSGEEMLPPISRAPDNRISLKEEMVALNDLDIGKLGGMVCSETSGKREMRGFLYIPTVWAETMNFRNHYAYGWGGRASIHLAEAVNRYTGLTVAAGPQFFFSSDQLLRMPFIHFSAYCPFELTSSELQNFARYLKTGGFAFLDNATPEYENNPAGACLRKMVRDALGSRARFEPLPVSHPLYHCWFDFADGPPQGDGIEMQTTSAPAGAGYYAYSLTMQKPVFYLEGVYLDGELVAVYSNKGYTVKWSQQPSYYYWGTYSSDNTPQLRMGVNLVVYALTREGGMNRREMARYSDIP